MERRAQQNSAALAAVLDAEQANSDAMAIDGNAGSGATDALDPQLQLQQAQAQAAHAVQRLRVAQEQISEYAIQSAQDISSLSSFAQQLDSLCSASAGSDLQQAVQSLKQKLADAALAAKSFADQQKQDAENFNKRSSQQAGMVDQSSDDSKRPRESTSGGPEEAEADDVRASAASGPQAEGTTDAQGAPPSGSCLERARYIPMRLALEERRLLRLLEAALNVSEYTDKVDVLTWRQKTQRIHAQIKDICAILSGLVVAQDYRRGQELVRDRDFVANQEFFQAVFEIGRRYKIQNPDKMRAEYGKLMYMLMDSSSPEVQDLLEFKCVKPLQTVYTFLEAKGGLRVLEDPLMGPATAEIIAGDRPRHEVQRDIKLKEKARDTLAKRYCNSNLSQEEVLNAIYSFSDNNTYLLFNRDPVDRMITYFRKYFRPDEVEDEAYSLAIQGGKGGARLTHNHERQYHYVLQSLTLWREISNDMFKLWYLAEHDMLREGNHYRLCDTGQGLNRVQSAPSVGRAMQAILTRCQQRIGHWVGSSVVHLGDHNVPNALHFIDKYTQVPRILNPVVAVLDELPKLYRDRAVKQFIDSAYGGLEEVRKEILTDFCRHAFDGSGADNFFDAGSCIDGRLTSAWNWCSKLEKKHYFHIFRLAGFVGFDGDFK